MKWKDYKKLMEEIEHEACELWEGLEYVVKDEGLVIKYYVDGKKADEYDVWFAERIIYNDHITKDDIERANKGLKRIEKFFDIDKEEISLYDKAIEAHDISNKLSYCFEYEIIDSGLEHSDAIQDIYRTAEMWGILYLWFGNFYPIIKNTIEDFYERRLKVNVVKRIDKNKKYYVL